MRLTEDGLIPVWQAAHDGHRFGHAHFWERALTRRQFLGTAALAGGAAATATLWTPLLAQAAGGTPKPIPGGTTLPFQPTPFHFYFPTANAFSPFNVENGQGDPSLIFDFKGDVAVADLHGTGTGTDTATGTEAAMFWAADVRTMKGTFVFQEGNTGRGAFAFIWLDVYTKEPLAPPNQVHDFNPGVNPFPTGLFWTTAVPSHSIEFDFEDAEASLDLESFEIDDYHDVVNALTTDHDVNHGQVDVNLEWRGVLKRGHARVNDSGTMRKFETHWINDNAKLEWSANEPGFKFESETSVMGFGQIARERNGSFFK